MLDLLREEKRHAVRELFRQENSLYCETQNVYMITHTYAREPEWTVFVKANISPKKMDLLVAYLQFEMGDMDDEITLNQLEVAQLLKDHYQCEILSEAPSDVEDVLEIDLYENWELWCSIADTVQEQTAFHREGLANDLQRLYEKNLNEDVTNIQ